jgi:hypothetical protein
MMNSTSVNLSQNIDIKAQEYKPNILARVMIDTLFLRSR